MSWCNERKFLDQSNVCEEREKWSENKLCRLVCLYRKFTCLWKKDDPFYMDNTRRHRAYSSIHQRMEMSNVTFTEVMIKIRELRRAYVNELQKILIAEKVGRKYEPRYKWFISFHKFLYQHLDFDEVAELRDPEDSVSSCYRQDDDDDDEDEGSQYLDTDSDYNADSSVDESRNYHRCRRVSCNSSPAGSSSTKNSRFAHLNSNHSSSSGKKDSCKRKLGHNCPLKIVECSHREHTTGSEICKGITERTPRSKKSTSVTIICDKKTDIRCPKNETNCNAERKLSACIRKKDPLNSSSGPGASSVEKFDSNDSLLNTHDEFEVFAKSVACQLRKMDAESALMAQNEIQSVLTDQKLRRSQQITPETSETKELLIGVEIQKLPSPHQSATRVRSRMIKPAMSKRLLAIMNPKLANPSQMSKSRTTLDYSVNFKAYNLIQNVRQSEIRIDERRARETASRLSDPTPHRKTKRNSLK